MQTKLKNKWNHLRSKRQNKISSNQIKERNKMKKLRKMKIKFKYRLKYHHKKNNVIGILYYLKQKNMIIKKKIINLNKKKFMKAIKKQKKIQNHKNSKLISIINKNKNKNHKTISYLLTTKPKTNKIKKSNTKTKSFVRSDSTLLIILISLLISNNCKISTIRLSH